MLRSRLVKVARMIDDARFEISKMKDVPDEAIVYLKDAVNSIKDIISILKSAEDFDELLVAAARIVAEDNEEDIKIELSTSDQTEDNSK